VNARDLVNVLLRAANAPKGLLIATNDPERAKRAFYNAKRGEPDVPPLEFRTIEHAEGNLLIRRPQE